MRNYDVVVVGAGIQGAAVAQAAAFHGWSVLLLEQFKHPAHATSSRSSKLIHGGLRYLESAQFSLVRQCLRERRLLLRNAPQLVTLRDFYIPVYRSTRRRPWKIRLGLTLYALLAGLHTDGLFRKLPRSAWGDLDGLKTDGLRAVYRYRDAQTDDATLTDAVVASATSFGAQLMTSSRLVRAEISGSAVEIKYRSANKTHAGRAKVLVNAAGPWVNRVLASVHPTIQPLPIELVQGTHVVLPGRVGRGIYYVESPHDGRAVFVMPWKGRTLVGTTETPFHGDPATVAPRPEEIQYLLDTHGHYFPDQRKQPTDVVEAFAGLRVLPAGTTSAFSRPRETRLHTDRHRRPRVLSIYGGKLTAYRAVADDVVQRIAPSLPPRPKSDTRHIHLAPPPTRNTHA